MGQWLGLHAFIAKGLGSIPGQGTKIPQAMQCDIWTAKQYHRILGVIKIFCILIMVVVSQIYTTLKTHQTVHFT